MPHESKQLPPRAIPDIIIIIIIIVIIISIIMEGCIDLVGWLHT